MECDIIGNDHVRACRLESPPQRLALRAFVEVG